MKGWRQIMKQLYRSFTILCLIAAIFSMTGCSHNTKDDETGESYVARFFDIPDEVKGISRLLASDETAYMCCSENDEISYIASISMDGSDFQKLPLQTEDSIEFLDFGIDQQGCIWTVCRDHAGGYSLRKFDSSNSLVQSVDLTSVLDDAVLSSVDKDLSISIDAKGNICLAAKCGSTYAYLFDSSGQFLFPLNYGGNFMTTITTAEGKIGVCATTSDRMNYDLLTVDMDNKNWHKDIIYLGAVTGIYGGHTSNFYRFDSSSLYGYNSGEQEGRRIFGWSDMGLNTADVHLCELEDGRFVVLAASSNQASVPSYEMAVLTKGSDKRTVLSMTSLTANPSVVQTVSDFNKTNKKYKIELTEYFPYEQNVSDEDWNNAITNLNTQIISGDTPDILDMSDLSVQIYHNKGLLEDLYTYMEKDPEINRDDYFGNVFDAIGIDGKLPYITNGVAVSTMLSDASALGDTAEWTLKDLEDVLETSGTNAISNLSSEAFLKIMLQTSDSLVDWSLGECFFDSSEFIELLEFAGKIQDNIAGNNTDMSAGLASYETINSVYQIARYRDLYKGNLNLLGLPSDSGEYHAVKPEVKIGISSSGNHKDGAWEFVKMFLMEEHQESCYMLPIHKGAFDTVMQAAIDGNSMWTLVYENLKAAQEDAETVKGLISGASYVVNDNLTLENIILEEAAQYFAGTMSAQEAAEKIQSRATLYIKEQM